MPSSSTACQTTAEQRPEIRLNGLYSAEQRSDEPGSTRRLPRPLGKSIDGGVEVVVEMVVDGEEFTHVAERSNRGTRLDGQRRPGAGAKRIDRGGHRDRP